MGQKRKIIVITDGDKAAKNAIELVAKKVGGKCISASAGNPTPLDGAQIIELIKKAPSDPVFVMIDDKGHCGKGRGEQAFESLLQSPEIEILGVVAVASDTLGTKGVKVDISITKEGQIVNQAVNKQGNLKDEKSNILEGDTVDILNDAQIPVIIGIGDIGKMEGFDSLEKQSPVTTRAIEEILIRSGYLYVECYRYC
jgi:stage V sporulation protein AE